MRLLVNGCVRLPDTTKSAIRLHDAWVLILLGKAWDLFWHGPDVENLASLVEFEGVTSVAKLL